MADHPLHGFDIRAGRDGEAHRRMPEILNDQSVEPDLTCRSVETTAAEDPVAEDSPAADTGEQQVIAARAHDVRVEQICYETRHRHRSPLVGLRHTPDEAAVDFDDGLGDLDPATEQVETGHLERCQLAPARPTVGQDQNHEPVLREGRALAGPCASAIRRTPGSVRQPGNFGVGQIPTPDGPRSRQRDAAAGIPRESSVPDGEAEHAR